jgi:hypothetical protein
VIICSIEETCLLASTSATGPNVCSYSPNACLISTHQGIAALKALHIIPLTPSPSPPPQPCIQPAINAVKEEPTTGIKREADDTSADGEVEFMRSKRLKHWPTSKDEVIVMD